MIIGIFMVLGIIVLYVFIAPLSLLGLALPTALISSIQWAFLQIGIVQAFAPMFPDPTMTGLAHDMGLITIFGWTLRILYGYTLFRLLKWGISKIPFFHIQQN